MTQSSAARKAFVSPQILVIAAIGIALLVAWVVYLNRPVRVPPQGSAAASAEAKSYVRNLELSAVTLQASESLANQRLVEVQGKITNHGERSLRSVQVFCLFYSPDNREIHRERVSIVPASGRPLTPNETRDFRLAFDALPPEWNQAVPRMVIAGIEFAS